MRITQRLSCLFVVISVFAFSHAFGKPDPDHRKVVTGLFRNKDWHGSAAAIGPDRLVTASHCLKVLDQNYWVVSENHPNGVPVEVRQINMMDTEAAIVSGTNKSWLPPGRPVDGPAEVVTLSGIYPVDLRGPFLFGWRPYAGSSGSPVVQDGKIVGVVRAKSACPSPFCGSACPVQHEQWGVFAPLPEEAFE